MTWSGGPFSWFLGSVERPYAEVVRDGTGRGFHSYFLLTSSEHLGLFGTLKAAQDRAEEELAKFGYARSN
jgi:hypothetical protein